MLQSMVSSSVVSGLGAFIRELGHEPDRIVPDHLRAFLDASAPALSTLDFMELLNACAETTATPDFGLRFGARYRRRDLGLIAYLFTYNQRVANSIAGFEAYFSTLQTHSHYATFSDGDRAVIEYLAPGPDPRFKAQDAEFSMMVQVRCLQFSLGPKWLPDAVEFEHQRLSDPTVLARYFPCEIRFGCSMNRILFPKRYLFLENPQADPQIVALIENALDAERAVKERPLDFLDELRGAMRNQIRKDRPVSVETVARSVGLSVHQLDYRMRNRGISFRDMLNDVRLSEAETLLGQSGLAISTIALRLGYSEVSAFSRWFRARTGMAATRYRKERLGTGASPLRDGGARM